MGASDWRGLVGNGVVWVTIVWMILAVWPHYRWVVAAQVPYFVWVSIATVLQLSSTWMNRASG